MGEHGSGYTLPLSCDIPGCFVGSVFPREFRGSSRVDTICQAMVAGWRRERGVWRCRGCVASGEGAPSRRASDIVLDDEADRYPDVAALTAESKRR